MCEDSFRELADAMFGEGDDTTRFWVVKGNGELVEDLSASEYEVACETWGTIDGGVMA